MSHLASSTQCGMRLNAKIFDKMKGLLTLAIVAVSLCSVAQTNVKCGSADTKPRHYMKVTVDKIDNSNSDGVSRVSCTLVGVPHTSSRIDSVTAVVAGKRVKATDIDGVDFNRYFQWEDEGAIPVDVDIAKSMKFTKNDTIKFHTVHGVYAAPLK